MVEKKKKDAFLLYILCFCGKLKKKVIFFKGVIHIFER